MFQQNMERHYGAMDKTPFRLKANVKAVDE